MATDPHRTGTRFPGIAIGTALIGLGMLLLAGLQYLMPFSHRYIGSIDLPGMHEYAHWLARLPDPTSIVAFQWAFRALVLLVWLGYVVLLYAGFRHGISRPMTILVVAASLAVMLAVVFPPSLSHDLYAYIAYGRMAPLYGLNPYTHSLEELSKLGDAAALHYVTPASSVYGPVWTLITSGLAVLLNGLSVSAQLVAFKLVEAAALVGAAVAARSIARVWDPQHADLALIAVALNPVLLLEGPCNGHNDVLMVALMLAGIALVLRGSWQAGYLVLGLSVGVKYVSAAIVPWVVIEQIRSMSPSAAVRRATAAIALTLLPLLLAFVPYGAGLRAASGVGAVYSTRSSGDVVAIAGMAAGALIYLVATVWIWRGKGDRLAPAWTVWSTAAALWMMPGTMLPWYMTWPTGLTFTRWDRRQVVLSATCSALGLYWMLHYVVLRGG